MKRSLLMTVSVLVLFSFILAGIGTDQKSKTRGIIAVEHGVEF